MSIIGKFETLHDAIQGHEAHWKEVVFCATAHALTALGDQAHLLINETHGVSAAERADLVTETESRRAA
jgi:hypothetical protein